MKMKKARKFWLNKQPRLIVRTSSALTWFRSNQPIKKLTPGNRKMK